MSPLNRCFALPVRQRGAIGLIVALTLGLALLFMLVVIDSGRLYLEKRSLQRVADIAALEAASRKGTCATGNSATLYATQSATRNGFTPNTDGRTLTAYCGSLSVNVVDSRRSFVSNASSTEAIQVTVSRSVPTSVAAGVGALFSSVPQSANTVLSATAVAAAAPPLAQLTIRTALADIKIDNTKATILNALIGGLLGGSLNLSVASWQGLVDAKLNLFNYLDRLKTDLNITAVGYTQVLSSNLTVSQLIQSTINLLQTNGTLSTSATILDLQALKTVAGTTTVVLGDLIKVQGGSDIAGLDSNLRVFELIQGLAQVANKKNGVTVNTQINLAGLAQVTAQLKIIEPPQLSAIGDPSKINPLIPVASDPNRIYVRTAQTRALISINLPVLDVLNNPPVSAVTGLVGSLLPILNSALSLNIVGVVGGVTCLLGAKCQVYDPQFLTSTSSASAGPRIDLSLTLAAAESYVTGYTCASNTSKSLTVRTNATLLSARLGLIDSAAAFPVSTDPTAVVALPLPIIDIGTKTCTQLLGLLGSCTTRVPYAGGGLGLSFNTLNNTTVGSAASSTFSYSSLPERLNEVGDQPSWRLKVDPTLPSTLLDGIVSGVKLDVYKPVSGNVLGSVITGTGTLLNTLLGLVDTLIESTLKPLLTSLVDPLLAGLGLTLNPTDVGANLSCNIGQATLVI